MWAFPSSGRDLEILPTTVGAKWRFNSKLSCDLPFIAKINSIFETDPALIFQEGDYELYNVCLDINSMSDEPEEVAADTEEVPVVEEEPVVVEEPTIVTTEDEISADEEGIIGKKEKKTKKGELSPEESAEQARLQKIIDQREIIEIDPVHVPVEFEVTGKVKVMIGPPTLTRFEKARILGARALQLSLGAPPFIKIPKEVATSLDLAYSELEKRVIPITIRRVLPNGDFQNIPIDLFN